MWQLPKFSVKSTPTRDKFFLHKPLRHNTLCSICHTSIKIACFIHFRYNSCQGAKTHFATVGQEWCKPQRWLETVSPEKALLNLQTDQSDSISLGSRTQEWKSMLKTKSSKRALILVFLNRLRMKRRRKKYTNSTTKKNNTHPCTVTDTHFLHKFYKKIKNAHQTWWGILCHHACQPDPDLMKTAWHSHHHSRCSVHAWQWTEGLDPFPHCWTCQIWQICHRNGHPG